MLLDFIEPSSDQLLLIEGIHRTFFSTATIIAGTLRASGLLGWDLEGVAWSGTRFSVVGGAQYQPASNTILTSVDGATWMQQTVTVPGGAQYFLNVLWADSKFVAIGAPAEVAISSDGLTWQVGPSSNDLLQYAISWTGSNFVSGGFDIDTSPDGITWTRTVPTSTTILGIVWGKDKYVAVGGGGVITTSP